MVLVVQHHELMIINVYVCSIIFNGHICIVSMKGNMISEFYSCVIQNLIIGFR